MRKLILIIMCLLVPFFAFSQSKPIKPKTQTTTTSGSSAQPPKKKTNTVSSKPTKQNAQTTRPTTSGTTKPISPQKDTGSTSPTTQQANTGSSSTSNNSVVSSSAARSKTYSVNGVTFEMVTVEGGSFRMGADDSEAWDDEKPVHSETVSTFRIGKTEVTQALWTAVMGSNPSNFKGDNLPVEKVSWNDCKTFISKLNSLTGENFRLPTESEWEYAARGGNKSRGYKYSGSNSIGEVAWYYGNSGSKTHPVATKSPNELGIYDMSGNVWEWTSDIWCGDYNSSRSGSDRVSRGGSWNGDARSCRVSGRNGSDPSLTSGYLGLRLAL